MRVRWQLALLVLWHSRAEPLPVRVGVEWRAVRRVSRGRDQHCIGLLSPGAWPEVEPQLPVERERCSAACISSSSCEIEGGRSGRMGGRMGG